MNTDNGMLVLGPWVIDRVKKFKDGREVIGYHQTGFATSNNNDSPIHNASIYVISTVVKDAEGKMADHARLIQFIGASGDVAWAYAVRRPDTKEGEYSFKIKSGIGCWKNIVGTINETGFIEERVDGFTHVSIEASFEIGDGDRAQYYEHKTLYKNYDQGYSFHGAHIHESQIDLPGCEIDNIVLNKQNGVIISEVTDSPRHDATCCDRGYMMRKGDRTLGDVMLLEDTDAEGNVIWIYHEWWYGVGPGIYEIMGGHGKWSGISGTGNSVSMISKRQDEWFMPTWELSWNI